MTKLELWKENIQRIQLQIKNNVEKPRPKSDLNTAFDDFGDIRFQKLFVSYFGDLPNVFHQEEISFMEANDYFNINYQNEFKNHAFEGGINAEDFDQGKLRLKDYYYFLYEDLIVHFDVGRRITYLFKKTDVAKVKEIIDRLSQFFHRKKEKPEIHLLVNSRNGIETKKLNLTKPKMDIESNYNNDFLPIHETIFRRLNQKNDKGLVLLHGKPGTGKTSYLRFLASTIKKKIIFIPPDMAAAMTKPDLISLLMDNRNSILVIEDAEKIILERDLNDQSPVSTLLNLADGLLADCLHIQVICSFNTNLANVDRALLRKGRLIAKYEFTELHVSKAQALSNKLGFKTQIINSMTLTDIYNQEEQEFIPKKGKTSLGFEIGLNSK
ncbi:AAA family ATPase [Sphingobacterium sp. 1.A.4]|uniref:AAA family ATPase n=1 Tax=Sphingobacterium sp. 1.A.4 TaxID=2044603 RepID=UPI000C0BD08D|nr:AAA family ATPase [Sphingobacterium sp. 1.A.4]